MALSVITQATCYAFCTFFNSLAISPPPMTSASYWDFKAVRLDVDLDLITVPTTVTDLRPRSDHTAAAMAGA